MVRRRMVTDAEAKARATAIVPDPGAMEAPPHEHAPWDEDDGGVVSGAPASSTPEESRAAPAGSPGSWGSVIDDVYRIDPEEAYRRLKSELMLGDAATSYGEVLVALDRADRNTLDALRLARLAKLEDDAVAHRISVRLEVMRSTAKDELEAAVAASFNEKLGKATKKAPTLQDIEDHMVANWPDQVGALRRQKEEMHGTLRVMEGLHAAWVSRAQSLRKIMERVAPVRG